MANYLMILAHPDDEVIFGWPVVQLFGDNDNQISLLALAHNEGKYGYGPKNALKEVCNVNNINLLDFPRYDTNFYRLPTRYESLVLPQVNTVFSNNIQRAVEVTKPDCIFTHNPMGEYGHGDHRMTFNLVSMLCDVPLLLTDICFFNRCHLSSNSIPDIYTKYLYSKTVDEWPCKLDMNWYNAMMEIYKKHKAWSWGGHDAITKCKLRRFV